MVSVVVVLVVYLVFWIVISPTQNSVVSSVLVALCDWFCHVVGELLYVVE